MRAHRAAAAKAAAHLRSLCSAGELQRRLNLLEDELRRDDLEGGAQLDERRAKALPSAVAWRSEATHEPADGILEVRAQRLAAGSASSGKLGLGGIQRGD